jgi:hypothetical protein
VRVDEVVLRALERVPEQRWQSAEEVRRAVAAAMAERGAGRTIGLVTAALLCVLAGLVGAAAMRWAPRPPEAVVASPAAPAPPPSPAPVASAPPLIAIAPPPSPAPVTAAPPPEAAPATPVPIVAAPAPVVAPPVPAEPTAAVPPVAGRLDGHDLAIDGTGDLVIEIEAGASDLSDIEARHIPGLLRIGGGGERGTTLRLLVPDGAARLPVPPELVRTLRFDGSGTLRLRGLRGERLVITSAGGGSVIATDLAVRHLELIKNGGGPDAIGGRADAFTVEIGASSGWAPAMAARGVTFPNGGASGTVDAHGLAASSIEATLGGGALKLGGHAAALVLRLIGSGSVDAPNLAVDHADVTITGWGTATLGELQALDATCTGGGELHYSGNPKLGRVVTGR